MAHGRAIALLSHKEISEVLNLFAVEADAYLNDLDELPLRAQNAHERPAQFERRLPDEGTGAVQALEEHIQKGLDGAVNSSSPRFFHFITGGKTPAAMGANRVRIIGRIILLVFPGNFTPFPLPSSFRLRQLVQLPVSRRSRSAIICIT